MVNFRARLNEILTDFTSLDVKKKKKARVPDGFCGHGVRMLSRIGMHVNCESRSHFFCNFFNMCWHEAIFLLFLYIAMVNKFA